jgi:signal transduction histidine kinase/ActR/RegA family two-component response regulator
MTLQASAIDRFLHWRATAVWQRICQAAVVGALAWLMSGERLILAWFAVAVGLGLLDAQVSRLRLARPGARLLHGLALGMSGLSAASFASIAALLVLHPNPSALAGACLVLCAVNLNNAVMSRGTALGTLVVAAPSGVMAAALPVIAITCGYPIKLNGLIALEAGAIGFVTFTGLLAAMLRREGTALRAALLAAETANRAKCDFLSAMSHEIRTPLNGVLCAAQIMERGELSHAQRAHLQVIDQSGRLLLAMLNDVLDLSRLDARKLELDDQSFDIGEMIAGVRDAFLGQAHEKGLDFNMEINDAVHGAYRGDPTRIRQILYNLVSNALKFTDAGAVRIAVEPMAKGVRIAVIDTGVGLAPERVGRLFDQLGQADASLMLGGGLGLAICKDLCVAMGGSITVHSDLGHGSRFDVDLPLIRDAAREPAATGPSWDSPIEPTRALRILAADDNPVNQLLMISLLREIGVEVVIAADGQEAIEAWEREPWDVILMDVRMPVMDGPTATRHIRQREAETGREPTPIIAVTANATPQQAQFYRAVGMDNLVPKPIDVIALFAAISQAVETPTAAHLDSMAG